MFHITVIEDVKGINCSGLISFKSLSTYAIIFCCYASPEGFETAFIASAKQTLVDTKRLRIKEQMREITQFVSMSYIAKNYFNKTKSWLSQRINGNDVNGRPARFTPEEIDTLNKAFSDLSQKLGAFRVSL